jgi:hypothetical protein
MAVAPLPFLLFIRRLRTQRKYQDFFDMGVASPSLDLPKIHRFFKSRPSSSARPATLNITHRHRNSRTSIGFPAGARIFQPVDNIDTANINTIKQNPIE